jgi:hypothetical protein
MARSSVSVKQIVGDARMLSGALDAAKITDADALVKFNTSLNSIYTRLNGSKFRKFMSHFPIDSGGTLITASRATNKTYTASTKKILATSAASTWVGGLCMFEDNSGNVYFATITAITANTDFTVSSGPTSDITAGNLSYGVFLPPQNTSALIEGYRADNIVRIHLPLAGDAPILNEDEIESASANPNYDSSTAFVHTGVSAAATVKFKVGTSTTNSGGYPVMFFEEKPYKASAVTDYVDLPTEYHSILVEELARQMIIQLGSKVPKALESPMLTISAFDGALDETISTFMKSEDK